MAEPLKNQLGPDTPRHIARMVTAVSPAFPAEAFIHDALEGYEQLNLMQRGRKIALSLRRYLPSDYAAAIEILTSSFGPRLITTAGWGMAPFLYLPHSFFVAEYGLDHFELSMQAQYELTQRFTAEFCIRPYLQAHRDATLARLKTWVNDPSPHVRRLVSEGTRPRLPWAQHLREFQADPRPVLELLELLKDDPEPYVRRSVANSLNDIGKDHPELLADIARRWMHEASEERRRMVRHALRSAIKRGERSALAVLGCDNDAQVNIGKVGITPQRVRLGESVTVSFEITGAASCPQQLLIDLRIHYVKANGKTSSKVYKLKTLKLAPAATSTLSKTIALKAMTTRQHYSGVHRVELVLNGVAWPLGQFDLRVK